MATSSVPVNIGAAENFHSFDFAFDLTNDIFNRIHGTALAKTRLTRRAGGLSSALQDGESTTFSSSPRQRGRRRQNQSLRQLDTSVNQVV